MVYSMWSLFFIWTFMPGEKISKLSQKPTTTSPYFASLLAKVRENAGEVSSLTETSLELRANPTMPLDKSFCLMVMTQKP